MSILRTLLIDDDPLHIDRLDRVIKHYCPQTVQIVGHSQTVKEGLHAIENQRPDLIFLDVKLDDGQNGFELLSQVSLIDFDVIFCTSYEDYALEAFRADAVDYLLKPVDSNQLIKAVNKVLARSPRERAEHLQQLTEATFSEARKISLVRLVDGTFLIGLLNATFRNFINVADIYYCIASDGKTIFFGRGQKEKDSNGKSEYVPFELTVASHSLGDVEEILKPLSFFRIHDSHIINLAYMKSFRHDKQKGIVTLTDKKELGVSVGCKGDFLKVIQKRN